MTTDTKATASVSPDLIAKARHGLISDYLSQLATAANLVLTDERRVLYCRALEDLTEVQLRHGFQLALKHLGAFLPTVEQIRIWSESWRPPDEQRDVRELTKQHLIAAGRKAGISSEEIRQWMDAGKEAQNEHIAKLEADPEWQALRQHLGGLPGLTKRSQQFQSEADRKIWATQQAQEAGWISSQTTS